MMSGLPYMVAKNEADDNDVVLMQEAWETASVHPKSDDEFDEAKLDKNDPVVIDLSDDDDDDELIVEESLSIRLDDSLEQIDLTQDDDENCNNEYEDDNDEISCLGDVTDTLPSVKLPLGSFIKRTLELEDGSTLKPHSSIEFLRQDRFGRYDGGAMAYFYVRQIYVAPNGQHFLEGLHLAPLRDAGDMLPRSRCELVIRVQLMDARMRPAPEVCKTIIPLPEVLICRKIHFTNALPPSRADQHQQNIQRDYIADWETRQLFCRWVHYEKIRPGSLKVREDTFVRLSESHFQKLRVSDQALLESWRQSDEISASSHADARAATLGTYTYGSICCGAGGDLRGALDAGLVLRFGLDNDPDAIRTCKTNRDLRGCEFVDMDLSEFATSDRGCYHVDILHISFPCQGHSRLNHTRKWDDPRNLLIMAVTQLLKRCRPRIVTFEQTAHMAQNDEKLWYRVLLGLLTEMNFSVTAREEKLEDFGNAATRERLIVIAAAPGQQLPTSPEPTYGPGREHPYVTVREVLTQVRHANAPDHMRSFSRLDRSPWNPNTLFKGCLTTGSGKWDVHPNGKRTLTLLERAALQCFPPETRFTGSKTTIARHIGNAYPARPAGAYLKHIVACMKEQDARIQRSRQAR